MGRLRSRIQSGGSGRLRRAGVAARSPPRLGKPRQRSSERSRRDSACAAVVEGTVAVAAMEPAEPLNDLVSAEGRNRKAVLCQRCGSRVLQPGTALFSRRQVGRQVGGASHPHVFTGAAAAGVRVPARVSGDRAPSRLPAPPEAVRAGVAAGAQPGAGLPGLPTPGPRPALGVDAAAPRAVRCGAEPSPQASQGPARRDARCGAARWRPVYPDSRPASRRPVALPDVGRPLRPRGSSRNYPGVGNVTDASRDLHTLYQGTGWNAEFPTRILFQVGWTPQVSFEGRFNLF